ncbi:MAG: N-6 DNA methylase [Cytophagales bacterium]|nr:N-6 DNA methylase [Cytophagales bacterium]
MAKRTKKEIKETPAQRLSGIVKRCRNIMRKDKGLNGDADRLPMLTWIMFLKFLDDNEIVEEAKKKLKGEKHKPLIPAPYRWRDWAGNEEGMTGDDLLDFINNETCKLPNGKLGKGLFYYLRGLVSEEGNQREDVLVTVFKGVNNRMINGYLLRDVLEKIDEIHFTSNEEINTLSHLYESLLREMRDASGDAGEFYTPRPVVQFMVEKIDPQIGETILDPAAGTGGFLVAAFDSLKKQAKTVEQLETLQLESIKGGEAKPLPYLLCQMNLLLHGLEYPQIDSGNSLRHRLNEIGDNERVDIILTNPPFGGEEERGILNNFPKDKQTAETTLLFIQLILRKLRRKTATQRGGRAAIVVPNGTLFADGIAARIKEQMLKDFNLHTVIRLSEGVFAPYTDIPANLLFFEQGEPTTDIWFFDIPTPEGRKKYSKTKPMMPEEFDTLRKWWDKRKETELAWKVDFAGILEEKTTEAQPFWDIAEAAKAKSEKLKEKVDQQKKALKELEDKEKEALQKEIRANEKKIRALDAEEKENQSKGDAIYYAAFNLDIKNPNQKDKFEYKEPSLLVSQIVERENQINGLIQEIQSIVTTNGAIKKVEHE